MKKLLIGLVIALVANVAFAKDVFIGIDPSQMTGAQIVKFTPPLQDGDRVILSFATRGDIEQPVTRGNVSFANQGEFTTFGNNQNEICLTFQGAGPVDNKNHNPQTVCGLLSGTVQFTTVGGLVPNKVYQAYFYTKGDAPDGIRVKLSPPGVPKQPRSK